MRVGFFKIINKHYYQIITVLLFLFYFILRNKNSNTFIRE
jgi:hypothetical protein